MTDAKYIVIQSISTTFIGILKSLKMNIANAMPEIIGIPINANLNIFIIGILNKIKVSKHNAPRKPSHP